MANRSDFFNTSDKTPKLPRELKKMLALMSTGDKHLDGDIRRIFINAHSIHVKYKLKKNLDVGGSDESNVAEAVVV